MLAEYYVLQSINQLLHLPFLTLQIRQKKQKKLAKVDKTKQNSYIPGYLSQEH